MREPRYFILIGDEQAWRASLSRNIWGFPERSVGNWNTCQIGDFVAFYVTSPIKKVVGYGQIIKKFQSEEIFWPDEKFLNMAIWKYRVEFKKLVIIDDWHEGSPVPKGMMLN